jgi:hypothetical protein
MDLLNYAIDPKKQVEGVWVSIGGGVELKLGRMNSEPYFEELQNIREPYIGSLPRGAVLDKKTGDDIYVKSLVRCILLGWRGDFTLNGKPVPEYSEELAYKILSAPELAPFRSMVVERAVQLNEFALGHYEELEGNLLSSSASMAS